MTPEQYVELHKRVTRLKLSSEYHHATRDLTSITHFERMSSGRVVELPCGREDEILKIAAEQGKIAIGVVLWNEKVPVYCRWRPTELDGYIREEKGGVVIGNDYNEILERILATLMENDKLIIGGPDDPRNEGGYDQYTPKK